MNRRLPTIQNLMEDPLYRAYMKTIPAPHPANVSGEPWRLWVRSEDGRWLTRDYASYREVWPAFVNRFKLHRQDPTIVSKRVFYAPPGEWYRVKIKRNPTQADPSPWKLEWRWRQLYFWDDIDLAWCGRCRRPSYWMPLFGTHHALRRMPAVTEENNTRCIICGIRYIATPSIEQMVKLERKPK